MQNSGQWWHLNGTNVSVVSPLLWSVSAFDCHCGQCQHRTVTVVSVSILLSLWSVSASYCHCSQCQQSVCHCSQCQHLTVTVASVSIVPRVRPLLSPQLVSAAICHHGQRSEKRQKSSVSQDSLLNILQNKGRITCTNNNTMLRD